MKRLYAFPLFLGLMLMNSTLMAQQENAFMKIDYSTGTANAIAPDGKWVVGGRAGEAFIYDTGAHQLQDLTETGMIIIANAVSNSGIVAGSYGSNTIELKPAYYKDSKWNELENTGSNDIGEAFAISLDDKKIAGYILDNAVKKPSIWTLEGNEYKIHILPSPEKDIFGMKPQGALVTNMSADGNILVGRFRDWSGMYNQIIIWKLDESKGEYDYQLLATDMMYNTEAENPGPSLEFSDFVTAEYGTPEYKEQLDAFNAAVEKRNELMKEFYKGVSLDIGSVPLSYNGQYLATSITMPDPEDTSSSINHPIRFDLKNNTNVIFSKQSDNIVCSVTNEGLLMTASPYNDLVRNSYIIKDENQEDLLPLNEWLKEKHNFDIDAELPESEDNDNVMTGTAFLSKNERNIYSFIFDVNSFTYINFCIQLSDKLNPTSIKNIETPTNEIIAYTKGQTLYTNAISGKVDVIDLVGKIVYSTTINDNDIDLAGLPKGIYVIKIASGEKEISKKIIIR